MCTYSVTSTNGYFSVVEVFLGTRTFLLLFNGNTSKQRTPMIKNNDKTVAAKGVHIRFNNNELIQQTRYRTTR